MERVTFGERLLTLLLDSLAGALPACTGVGLSLVTDTDGRPAAGTGVASVLDAAQWAAGDGPLPAAVAAGVATTTDDLGTDPRWPRLERTPDCAGQAVVAVPGSWDDGGPVVLSVYLSSPAGPAELAVVDRYEPLLATGLSVVEYCSDELVKADEIIDMMRRRRQIEQAKGVVMGRAGVAAEPAFEVLVRASQKHNVKVRDLAEALLARVDGRSGGATAPERVADDLWARLTALDT